MLVHEKPVGHSGFSAETSCVGSHIVPIGQMFFAGLQSRPQNVSPLTTLRTQTSNGPPHSASPRHGAHSGLPALHDIFTGAHCRFVIGFPGASGTSWHENPFGHASFGPHGVVQNVSCDDSASKHSPPSGHCSASWHGE